MRELRREADREEAAMMSAVTSAVTSAKPTVMEQRITRALEAGPEVEIPGDFAARVAARLPARPGAIYRATPTRYGQAVTLICVLLLLVAVVVLAPHTTGRSVVWLSLQWVLCAQMVGLLVWLRPSSQ